MIFLFIQIRQDGPLLDDSLSASHNRSILSSAGGSRHQDTIPFSLNSNNEIRTKRGESVDGMSVTSGMVRKGFNPGSPSSNSSRTRSKVSGLVRLPAPKREVLRGKTAAGGEGENEMYVMRGGFKMPASRSGMTLFTDGSSVGQSIADTTLMSRTSTM